MAQQHDDHRLLEALAAGSRPEIEEIYRRASRRCRSMVETNSGTAADSEELFQDVLLEVAAQVRGGFCLTCPLEPFLALVCRRRWLNELRVRQRQAVTKLQVGGYEIEQTAPAAADLAEFFLETEQRNAVARLAFERLGAGCRELLEAAWSGQFSMLEVAEKFGFTYGYARKKKHECLEKLSTIAHALPGFAQAKWG